MRNDWCRGFGSKEEDVLAMLTYANDQGRNLTADLRLMLNQDSPDYDLIRLHVPYSFYQISNPITVAGIQNPDEHACISSRLTVDETSVHSTPTVFTPSATGPAPRTRPTSSSARPPTRPTCGAGGTPPTSPSSWCRAEACRPDNYYAPYLKYAHQGNGTPVEVANAIHGVAYVNKSRWGDALTRTSANIDSVLPTAQERKGGSLRDSLDDTPPSSSQLYRGVEPLAGVAPAAATGSAYINAAEESRNFLKTTPRTACSGEGLHSIFDEDIVSKCGFVDPFLRYGQQCMDWSSAG